MDPSWVPIEEPPPCERFVLFKPPRAYRDMMLQDREVWAPGANEVTQQAIANVASCIVMPRFIHVEHWMRQAEDFFGRLCAHRRGRGDQTDSAIAQLQTRLRAAERQMDALRIRAEAAEQNLERLQDRCQLSSRLLEQLEANRLADHRAVVDLRVGMSALEVLATERRVKGSEKAAEAVRELSVARSCSPRGRSPGPIAHDTQVAMAQATAALARGYGAAETRAVMDEFLGRRIVGESRECSSLPPQFLRTSSLPPQFGK